MKERPILFSSPMVRAILAGTKTQTRRIMKPQPHPKFLARGLVAAVPQWPLQNGVRFFMADNMSELVACPHGAPGDRLWVRETWAPADLRFSPLAPIAYRADGEIQPTEEGRWRPSIHMPRAASRIVLDITSVRVERLQAITDADIAAEGVSAEALHGLGVDYNVDNTTPRDMWAIGWDAINGKRATWANDPWVWAIGFARVAS